MNDEADLVPSCRQLEPIEVAKSAGGRRITFAEVEGEPRCAFAEHTPFGVDRHLRDLDLLSAVQAQIFCIQLRTDQYRSVFAVALERCQEHIECKSADR